MRTRSLLLTATAALCGMLCSVALAADQAPHYHVTRTIALGAPDRWDYLLFDAPSQRVYVAHGDRLTVVNGSDGSIIGQVTGFPGDTHGTAIVHAVGVGYTDDGRAGEAGSFDLKTLQPGKHIAVQMDADDMVYDPASGHIFVVNGDGGTLSVIDPKRDAVIATVMVGGGLETAVVDGRGKLYVNGAEKSELVRVDTRTNTVDARWPIPDCKSPHGLAIDPATHRLFPSCVNKLMLAVDADSGAVIARLPIGSGTDAAAFDPKRKLVFSSNGLDGTLSIIAEKDPQTFVSLGSIPTAPLARTMAVDPASGRIYLVAAQIKTLPPGTPRPRFPPVVPGSLVLLFLDP